jgi:Protein of unknown function (DUF4058)
MPSPFPGMNPYLEARQLWAEFHSRLIVAIADALNPQILPKYRAAVERRIYEMIDGDSVFVGIPDVSVTQPMNLSIPSEISNPIATLTPQPTTVTLPMPEEVRESYLEIREVATGLVITVIELLSPKNKKAGTGHTAYETKRQQVLGSLAHFLEIDLLSSGTPMPTVGRVIPSRYRILISPAQKRPRADLYALALQAPIPPFTIPLRASDHEPILDLQQIIHDLYDRAGFALVIDYNQLPEAPLEEQERIWLMEQLQSQGLKN